MCIRDRIKGVTFVPLEVTTDDASLIDGVYDYAVTDRYIYVLPVKEPRIVLFDRQGRFIRTLVKEGQGDVYKRQILSPSGPNPNWWIR